MEKHPKICEFCKQEFTPRIKTARFCTKECQERGRIIELNKNWVNHKPHPKSVQRQKANSKPML